MCEDMTTAYRCYISSGKDVSTSYDLIISSFEDMLQNWYQQEEVRVPGIHALWKLKQLVYVDEKVAQAAGKHVGDLVLDSKNQPIPNAIGCLCWEIREEFTGFAQTQVNMYQQYLGKLRCTDLTKFEEYYNHYLFIVYQFSTPFDKSFKRSFLASLPSWFTANLYQENPGKWSGVSEETLIDSTWGYIKQACISLILGTCSAMRMNKATSQAYKNGQYKSLCKQRGLEFESSPYRHKKHFSFKSSKSSRFRIEMGGEEGRRYKYKKSKNKHAKSSKQSSRQKSHHRYAQVGQDNRHKPGRRSEKTQRKKKVTCYNCGGSHYANECKNPKKKDKQVNWHKDDDSSYKSSYDSDNSYSSSSSDQINTHNSSSSDQTCKCFGECRCSLQMHNAEELSNVELIMKGIENAQSQQERDALWKMLQREMKEVSKEKKSEQKEKGKQSYVYPPYSLDTLMAQFGKKAQTSSKLTIESFHQEYTKEIKKIKSDIEVLYFALGAKENYSETESPKMPPLEKDDQDDQRKVGSMFINQHSNEVTGDNNISYIIRIPCIFAQDLKLTIHNFKALVDTGSRMNIINPCLVPARFREKCTSISGVNTSNGWSEVKW